MLSNVLHRLPSACQKLEYNSDHLKIRDLFSLQETQKFIKLTDGRVIIVVCENCFKFYLKANITKQTFTKQFFCISQVGFNF